MKAAVYYETGTPDVLRYEDVPDPACPAGGLTIDVQAISLEGGDLLHRSGGELAARPHIVGYQCAGVVREVASDVSDVEPGQLVVAVMPHGSHAERVAVPRGAAWQIPAGLDVRRAACVPIAVGTADDCLFEFGHLRAGESVLVHAVAGGVGMAAVQLAKRAGAQVFGTASSRAKLDRLKSLGLDYGIEYTSTDFVAAVRELTGGRGVDLVVDSLGGRNLERSIQATAYRGRVILVGRAGRDGVTPDVSELMPANRSLTGVFFGAELMLAPGRVRPMVARHLESVRSGDLEIVIDREFPLAEAAAAHAYVEGRHAFGRVLLMP